MLPRTDCLKVDHANLFKKVVLSKSWIIIYHHYIDIDRLAGETDDVVNILILCDIQRLDSEDIGTSGNPITL